MKQTIGLNQFTDSFKSTDRDCYSYEGYQALYDYYDEFEDFEFDVVAICGEVSEYTPEEILKDYGYLLNFDLFKEENEDVYETKEEFEEEYFKALIESLLKMTGVIGLDNNNFLIWSF